MIARGFRPFNTATTTATFRREDAMTRLVSDCREVACTEMEEIFPPGAGRLLAAGPIPGQGEEVGPLALSQS